MRFVFGSHSFSPYWSPYVICHTNICLFGYCTWYHISDQVHQLVLTLYWCILISFVGSVFLKDPFIAPFFTSPIRFSANPTTLDTCNPLANSQCAPGHLLKPRAGTASKRVPLGLGSRPLPFNVWMQWYREIYGNFAVWIILNHKV